jgi:glucose/arabinose dehydrogenase
VVDTVATKIITNMNNNGKGGTNAGNHGTRTLVWNDVTNMLYVSVGSVGNIDTDSFRARIRRFTILNTTVFPIDYATGGELFADGLRNEVAMEFSPLDGTLWGAGNSADQLVRTDLGSVIYNDNPAEEVHRFATVGQNYGYPYCWREYILPTNTSRGRGTAWSWPGSSVSDADCRNNYEKPVLAMQAHSAPLGLTFYNYKEERPSKCNEVIPFPKSMHGYIFIAFHGSWNRQIPTGYKVVYIPTSSDGKSVIGRIGANPIDLLAHEGVDAKWDDNFRPVDVTFDDCGRLLVSSDGDSKNKIVRIQYTKTSTMAPSRSPKFVPVPTACLIAGRCSPTQPAPVVIAAPTNLGPVPTGCKTTARCSTTTTAPAPVVTPSNRRPLGQLFLNFIRFLVGFFWPFQ